MDVAVYMPECVSPLVKLTQSCEAQYHLGVGGILADEMGLGKTIQTLSFLAALKTNGYPGPHLVVTPLAVLQNWQNEIKRFTPSLTSIKVLTFVLLHLFNEHVCLDRAKKYACT